MGVGHSIVRRFLMGVEWRPLLRHAHSVPFVSVCPSPTGSHSAQSETPDSRITPHEPLKPAISFGWAPGHFCPQ